MTGRAYARLGVLLAAGLSIPPPSRAQDTSDVSQRLDSVLLSSNPLVAEGDREYANRASGRSGIVADPRKILAAISSYDQAAKAPDQVEARWKLARALYYRGAYTGLEPANKTPVFDRARTYSDQAVRILEERIRRRGVDPERASTAQLAEAYAREPDAKAVFFWSAVSWGEWAMAVGKLIAAQRGAADRIRRDTELVIALDPEFEEGGGYRILGRLHAEAPRLPILTPWISRETGLEQLRKAMTISPDNFVNRLFLAEALYEHGGPGERQEAISLLEALATDTPSPTHLVENLRLQDLARKDLAEWKKAS
jgi:tetratricopeptide (TPR) repeat protein